MGWAFSAPYATGSRLEPFTAKDQHEQPFTLKPAETRFLLTSHDMETGRKAVYIANIHGMPGIGRVFALPKMKKYAHRIILADDAALIAKFPEQKGRVTVLKLKDGMVDSLAFWTPGVEALDGFLK